MNSTAQIATVKVKENPKPLAIEDVLAVWGILKPEQLSYVKNESKRRGDSTEKVITEMNWVTPEKLMEAKAQVIGVSFAKPDDQPLSPEVLEFIPEDVAKQFGIIPIGHEGNTISVAMVDPMDLQTIEFIEKKCGMR